MLYLINICSSPFSDVEFAPFYGGCLHVVVFTDLLFGSKGCYLKACGDMNQLRKIKEYVKERVREKEREKKRERKRKGGMLNI